MNANSTKAADAVSFSLGVYGLHNWFKGSFAPVVDLMAIADRKGIDAVNVTDHVVMGEATDKYPYGTFPNGPEDPWFEPMTFLAAVASVTRQIRLTTGVVIAPLRSAVLLAKQVATLDHLSGGRVTLGVGVGWQKEEYDASGLSFENRYRLMDDQLRACRVLWSEAPATFHSESVNFDRVYSLPYPVQKRLPVFFGVAPLTKNCARIAELGDGWLPMLHEPEAVMEGATAIRKAFAAIGRDPSELQIRVNLIPVMDSDGKPDLEASVARIPALVSAGATMIDVLPLLYCRGPEDFEPLVDRLVMLKQ